MPYKKKETKKKYNYLYSLPVDDENEENLKKEKDINVGVEILRMIYAFLVVEVHFGRGNKDWYDFAWKYIDFYVTSFFLMAFYFSYNTFSSRNISKIKERFLRLLYPYLLWPIIIYIRKNYYSLFHGHLNVKYLMKIFYIQYLLGNNIHGILWFLFQLIIVSLFICIIVFMFKDYHIYALYVVFILGSIYNYSKIHGEIMNQYGRSPIQHSLEIMNETIIFASTGHILGYYDIINVLRRLSKFTFIFFSPIFYIVKWHQECFDHFPRFNVIINTFFISSIFMFFATLPFHLCKNNIFNKIINIITRHTGGIYYLHTEAYDILINKYNIIHDHGTVKCNLFVYFATYLFCDICTRILKKWRLRYLFN